MINNSLVIGVAGGSGSGKSTFAKRICDYFGDKAVLISCDNYYLAPTIFRSKNAPNSITTFPKRSNSTLCLNR